MMLHGHQDMFTKPQFNIKITGKEGEMDDAIRIVLNNPRRLIVYGSWRRKQERCEHGTYY